MDFQNRPGGKTGSGAPASAQELALDRRERLRRLAMESVDLSKDPYMLRNHLGSYECKLCLTLHKNEGNYMAHTQGKKHQLNLARRAAKEKGAALGAVPTTTYAVQVKKTIAKIGRPGYKVTKVRDPGSSDKGMLFEIDFAEIAADFLPRYRVMSAVEQRVEADADTNYQYLLFAADPYETVAFKIPNLEIDKTHEKHYQHWDAQRKKYIVQLFFRRREARPLPAISHRPGTFDPIASRF